MPIPADRFSESFPTSTRMPINHGLSPYGVATKTSATNSTRCSILYGMGCFAYLAAHLQQAEIFNEAMAEGTRQVTHAARVLRGFRSKRTPSPVGAAESKPAISQLTK